MTAKAQRTAAARSAYTPLKPEPESSTRQRHPSCSARRRKTAPQRSSFSGSSKPEYIPGKLATRRCQLVRSQQHCEIVRTKSRSSGRRQVSAWLTLAGSFAAGRCSCETAAGLCYRTLPLPDRCGGKTARAVRFSEWLRALSRVRHALPVGAPVSVFCDRARIVRFSFACSRNCFYAVSLT